MGISLEKRMPSTRDRMTSPQDAIGLVELFRFDEGFSLSLDNFENVFVKELIGKAFTFKNYPDIDVVGSKAPIDADAYCVFKQDDRWAKKRGRDIFIKGYYTVRFYNLWKESDFLL